MSSILVKKPIGFYPVSGSNTGYYEVEGGGISRPSSMTDMFDTLSIKCRFRWPSFNDLLVLANSPMPADVPKPDNPTEPMVFGGLFGLMGPGYFGLVCAYQFGTDGSLDSAAFSSYVFNYFLPSLPVPGSDDEVEYRIGPIRTSLLYHGAVVAYGPTSVGAIAKFLENAFTLGVYIEDGVPYYHPGLISSAEITWYSSAIEGMSCVTNYYAAENITDSVWRNTADGVVVGAPALQELPIRAVFYDSSTNKFVKLFPDQITEAVPTYTPIGVEVIPAEHDVYGTGQAGIMSLVDMSHNTPDTGVWTSRRSILWGGRDVDTSLPNYDVVNLVDGTTADKGFLPSDRFTGATSLDGISKYYNTSTNAPSPFNADGSRNEAYYTTAYSTANALSDFDGVGNTKVLTELATSQSDWKTADTITNSYSAGYYPAACCCWRFHTTGTGQGQWYLPACGEFGYVVNRISAINTTINKVHSVYPSVGAVVVHVNSSFWSSSESGADGARYLNTGKGGVYNISKIYDFAYVRAFLRV